MACKAKQYFIWKPPEWLGTEEGYGTDFVKMMDAWPLSVESTLKRSTESGIQMGDIISNFKIENPDRPNKAIVYPFALLLLLIFGYNNYRQKLE